MYTLGAYRDTGLVATLGIVLYVGQAALFGLGIGGRALVYGAPVLAISLGLWLWSRPRA